MATPVSRRLVADTLSIREKLRETEAVCDEALLASSDLMKTIVRARQNPDVVAHDGQAALLSLVRAQKRILEGSTDVFRVHNELSKLGITYGTMDESETTPAFVGATLEETEPLQ